MNPVARDTLDSDETLHADAGWVLSRAREDGLRVLTTAPDGIRQMRQLLAWRARFDAAWSTAPEHLINGSGLPQLALTDPGGEPLSTRLGAAWSIERFLETAGAMAQALAELHARGLVHHGLQPASFLVDAPGSRVWLTGFWHTVEDGTAPRAQAQARHGLYAAPEQSGLMQRPTDQRSDLYALGACFYEMLAGRPPFVSADTMELVHAHLARTPEPLHERVPRLPLPLSSMVARLLAKSPDDRYQTAAGLAADLRLLARHWREQGRLDDRGLDGAGPPARWRLPQQLYGRDAELVSLRGALTEVATGGHPRLVLLSGPAGVGKTALVEALQRHERPLRARCATAKATPQGQDAPYATVAQLVHGLLRDLLSLPDADLQAWRHALQRAVGAHVALATELVPDLSLLLATAPPPPALAPAELRSLTQRLMLDVVQLFANPGEPLLLFIDDLQWVDAASLELVDRLVSDARPLLLIGAYRSNELSSAHALSHCLPRWRAMHPRPVEMALSPLKSMALSAWLADALSCTPAAARGLVGVLRQRTGGNPLFLGQMLTSLVERGLIAFDADAAAWRWDTERIEREARADDVNDILLARMARLPELAQSLLTNLTCLGGTSSLPLLAIAHGGDVAALRDGLQPALNAGLLRTIDPQVSLTHDRIREALLARVPPQDLAARHLTIARRLQAAQLPDDGSSQAYLLVAQFNQGADALRSRNEREQVARLNLAAAQRARAAGAPGSALTLASAGLRLLGPRLATGTAALRFELRLVRAECAMLVGDHALAARDLDQLQSDAGGALQRAAVCRHRVVLQVIRSDYTAAVGSALDGLRALDTVLPAHPSTDQVDRAYAEVMSLLGERDLDRLPSLPPSEDPFVHARMELLSELFAPACFTDAGLAMLHLCEMVRLSLSHGITPASGHGFAWFGIMIGQSFGAYSDGYRFARLAQQLRRPQGQERFEPKALFALEIASVWVRPMGEAVELSRNTHATAAEQGDIAIACFACHHTVNDMLVRGDALDDVAQAIDQGLAFVRRADFRDVEDELLAQQGFVAALRGLNPVPGVLDGDGFSESAMERGLTPSRMPTMAFWYWVLKAQARFYAGRFEEARAALAHADPLLWSAVHVQVLNHALFSGLVAAQEGDRDGVLAARDRFLHWHAHSPTTFDDKLALLDAELARVEGRYEDAVAGYERAIASARAAAATPYEALSAWLAGRCLAQRGWASAANGLLQHAHGAFLRWGAVGIARQLEAGLPARDLRVRATPGNDIDRLDLGAVMKLAQALAGEIELDRLVDTLMRLALEHAGASRGLLLRPDGKSLSIEAVATLSRRQIEVDRVSAAAPLPAVPWTVVHYAARTRRSVLLDDAQGWHAFAADPDLHARRPRSVLCLPLLRQTRLVGVLYLENALSSHVFTPGRSGLLELLASQAAIALENAGLYEALTRENQERRQAEQEARRVNQALLDSEGRFRLMAETSRDVIWITDLSPERVLYASPSFERIWGRTVRELYADPRVWTAQIHPEDLPRVDALFGSWIGGNPPGPFEAEFRVRRPDGDVRWIHDRGVAVLDSHGRPHRVSGIASDVTERHLAQAALRSSEQRFALAVAGSRDGVWDLDVGADQMFMSERAQQIFGLDPGEPVRARAAWRAAIPLHPDDRPQQDEALEAYLGGEAPEFDGEWRVCLPEGGERWIRVRGVCVRDADGRPQRLAGSVSDIDDQKRAQASLQQSQRLEAVGTLASGIAHDFNNILGAILGFGEMCMRHTRPGSRQRRDLECIITAGERGRALVERILAFSRSGAGERVAVHLEGVVREALQLLAPTVPASVRLEAQLETGLAAVMGDPTQVHQVVANLVTNALHALPQGGTLAVTLRQAHVPAPLALTTGTAEAGEYLVLSVEDNGTGIAPEIRDRIFDPFVTTRKAGAGSGLGLSLVHGIVTESGGVVDVFSRLGAGSRFDVYLPRSGEAMPITRPEPAALPRGRHQQVMVVDDEPLLVRLVTETLSELGYVAVGFTDPLAAAAAFLAHPERFDALVTDERMPDLPGSDLFARLRAVRADLPVLLMSGFLGADVGARAKRQGVHVLGKPVSRQELAATLARALSP